MNPDPLHESVDTLTRDQLVRLLAAHLTEDLNLDPEGGPHAQRAKLILDRLALLETGTGVDPIVHRALGGIAAHLHDAEIRLSQLARGG